VVKANAYGLGAARVGARLHEAGARHFFVAYPEEGAALRPHVGDAMIGVLNGFFADSAALYSASGLSPVLGNPAEISAWRAEACRLERRLPALLHVDSGMNRLGLSGAELDLIAADPQALRGIDVLYIMTHLANAEDPGDQRNSRQATGFAAACARLGHVAPRSVANSSGLFLGPAFRSDLARPGAALYGINPTPGQPNPMRPVLRLSAPILQMRQIAAGEPVGYNAIWTASRPSRVATVSVGYADGYHRCLSRGAFAGFDGGRVPLIGRVSMDLTTFDATDAPGLAQGSELELIGPAVPPDEVAGWAGTNGYEILTSLGSRVPRVYGKL
jgi:alanine racemase